MDIIERDVTINIYEYKLLMQSFNFITKNRDITTDRLPDIYLLFWSVDNFLKNPNERASDSQYLIFTFIMRRSLRASPHLKPLFNSYHIKWLFHYFQVILAATSYARSTHTYIKPIKLFDLNDYAVPILTNPAELLGEYQHITEKKSDI